MSCRASWYQWVTAGCSEAKCFHIPRNLTQICSHSRRQQRHQGGGGGGKNPPQQIQQQSPQHQRDLSQQQCPNQQQQQNSTELGDSRNGGAARPPRQYPGGHGPRPGGHSQNRRWHPSPKGQGQTSLPGDKGASPRTKRETEAQPARGEEDTGAPADAAATWPSQSPGSKPATNACPVLTPDKEAPPGSEKASEGQLEAPKISLLQSSKERLRRRLKDKVPKSCLAPVRAYYSSQDQMQPHYSHTTHTHLLFPQRCAA